MFMMACLNGICLMSVMLMSTKSCPVFVEYVARLDSFVFGFYIYLSVLNYVS